MTLSDDTQLEGWIRMIIRPQTPGQGEGTTRGIQGAVAVFLGRALADCQSRYGVTGNRPRLVFIDDLIDLALLATVRKDRIFNARLVTASV
jgi:UDP-glucose 4-epimerase